MKETVSKTGSFDNDEEDEEQMEDVEENEQEEQEIVSDNFDCCSNKKHKATKQPTLPIPAEQCVTVGPFNPLNDALSE